MARYGLRDDQWERIEDLLPGKLGDVGATARDNRRFVEPVLYRYRAGIPWRDLPERARIRTGGSAAGPKPAYGSASFSIWQPMAITKYAMIDSTIVRAHQHSAGALKKKLRTRHLAPAAAG